MQGNSCRAKLLVSPRPGIRLTERQQLALALRESERLAATIEYHDDVSDSCSSDAESEVAFSSVHGQPHQTSSRPGHRRRRGGQMQKQQAKKCPRPSSTYSPFKSQLADSLDISAIHLVPSNTPSTSDMCSSLDELSRRQQSSGATQDPLREVSVSQTDRDSDADDVGSPLHPLNHRLWSSNSDDSVTAAVAIPTDNDANSCAMRRQAPGDSGMQTIRQHSHITLGTHQTAASCKRSLDDATAGSHPDKRQRLSHDVADSQTVETFDVDPDVIERRRRRQQKLGGCKPASRQLPSVSTPRILATPSHQHLQPQPSLRRNATRQIYTVVLQESDPFAEVATAVQPDPPVRVRLRVPAGITAKAAVAVTGRGQVSNHNHQPSQEPIHSPTAALASSPVHHSSDGGHPEALVPQNPLPTTPLTTSTPNADAIESWPSTPRLQTSASLVTRQPASNATLPGMLPVPVQRDACLPAASPLPFGSPAVVRQFDASFFSNPIEHCDPSSAAEPRSIVAPSTERSVMTAIPMAATSAAAVSRHRQTVDQKESCPKAADPTPRLPQDTHTVFTATAAEAEACLDASPAAFSYHTPQQQRQHRRLRPLSSEEHLTAVRPSRVTSMGRAPPFLERLSPHDPPVVVSRARRSRAAISRTSSRSWADCQATISTRPSPITPRSDSTTCSRQLRSMLSNVGSVTASHGGGSTASLLSLDDIPRPRSGRFKAGALEAGCLRLRQLHQSARSPEAAAAQLLQCREAGKPVSGARSLVTHVSQSVLGMQTQQQAEGLLLQRRMESSDSMPVSTNTKQRPQYASVAAGCAALRRGYSSFKFPALPGLVADDSIANKWDQLTARQTLETSTLYALRDWLARGC